MKIIFTSCMRYEAFNLQQEWCDIAVQNPDYLFLLGDNIYMDFGLPVFSSEPNGAPENYTDEDFMRIMESKYANQYLKVPEFKSLVEKMRKKNGFYAIWDDHDFAWNNACGAKVTTEKKEISRALFHKYNNCSTNLPHVYYHVDTPFARVIFMDNRTDAEENGKSAKLLSDEQFEFIESKMDHALPFTLICGGLTLTGGLDNWTKYPSQLKKLCEITAKYENVIFLGGDIHKNTFVKPKKVKQSSVSTPVQLISSGMQVNFLGLGIPCDDLHNWAMIEIDEVNFQISFFNKKGIQKKLSAKANNWLDAHLFKR